MYKNYDVIFLTVDIKEENLRKGDIGTIVEIWDSQPINYEIEFCNELGQTIAMVVLSEDYIQPYKDKL